MDYETVPAEDFGAALQGLGINLLVTDVRASAPFLADVFLPWVSTACPPTSPP